MIQVFASVLAVGTLTTQVAQLTHLPFRHYCAISASLSIVTAAIAILVSMKRGPFSSMSWRRKRVENRPSSGPAGGVGLIETPDFSSVAATEGSRVEAASRRDTRSDTLNFAVVILLGICGSILALTIHRPDTDDYTYVPPAIFLIEHPDEPIDFSVHQIHTHGEIPRAYLASSYELYQASLAFTLGVEYLFVYYCMFPAIVGFLIPLAAAFALGALDEEWRGRAAGTLTIVLLYLLVGDTHRTFGNFAFARAQHGKTLFLSVGIPMFVGATLGFLRYRRASDWWLALCVSIGMIGCTASAAFILPPLGSVLVIAFACEARSVRAVVRRSLEYGVVFLYVGIYILTIWGYATTNFGKGALENSGWPGSFAGHLAFFFNSDLPATPFYLLAAVALYVLVGQRRRLILAWFVAAVALYLNPVVAPFVIENVTGVNTYWRLFYILPFPLMAGSAVVCFVRQWRELTHLSKVLASVAALITVLLGMHLGVHQGTIFRSGNLERVGMPGYKIRSDVRSVAQAVISSARPGVTLAPANIGGAVCMFSSRFPQLVPGPGGYATWLSAAGLEEEARERHDVLPCLDGDSNDFRQLWAVLSRHPDIANVVVHERALLRRDVLDELESRGFRVVDRPENFVLLTRADRR